MKKKIIRKYWFGLLFTMILFTFLSFDLYGANCNRSLYSATIEKPCFPRETFPDHIALRSNQWSDSIANAILTFNAYSFKKETPYRFPVTRFNPYCINKIITPNGKEFKPKEIQVDKKLKKLWIEQAIKDFFKQGIHDSIPVLPFKEVEFEDFYQKSIRLQGKGVIYFSENSWLYLVAHSEHEDPFIGDVTVGIDNKGYVYLNDGHICGGIIHFVINHKMLTNSVNDFIQHFKSDTEGDLWRKVPLKSKRKLSVKHL